MSISVNLGLRPAKPEEASELGELCLRSKAIWGYDEAFMKACRAELKVGVEEIRSGLVQVAKHDGLLAGIAEISFDDGEAYLEKLFIDPEYMGKGVGKALFEWAVKELRQLGAKEMIIEADPDAAAFYRRMGCADSGAAPSGSIPGRMLPRLVLEL